MGNFNEFVFIFMSMVKKWMKIWYMVILLQRNIFYIGWPKFYWVCKSSPKFTFFYKLEFELYSILLMFDKKIWYCGIMLLFQFFLLNETKCFYCLWFVKFVAGIYLYLVSELCHFFIIWLNVFCNVSVCITGSVIRLGRRHLFRFNHPGEVARMKEELKEVSVLSNTVWPTFC